MKFIALLLSLSLYTHGALYTFNGNSQSSIDGINAIYNTSHPNLETYYSGALIDLTSSYDTVSEIFTWNATFGEVPLHSAGSTPASSLPDGNRKVDAYTLVVSQGGVVPTGYAGNYVAQINVDFVDILNPTATVYSYVPGGTDFDGTLLAAANDPNINILATDLGNNQTRIELTIDASDINAAPLITTFQGQQYSGIWRGIEYDDNIGMWFHMLTGTTTEYEANGGLTNFSNINRNEDASWLDMDSLPTVPEPSSGFLLFLGSFGLVTRRKRS